MHVSIHAPRTGRDQQLIDLVTQLGSFNPRAPHGARPPTTEPTPPPCGFNPRAPHGARRGHQGYRPQRERFNPRAPHGARLKHELSFIDDKQFQSTRPARGATGICCANPKSAASFNPRAPHGARHSGLTALVNPELFQSTRPARGATLVHS